MTIPRKAGLVIKVIIIVLLVSFAIRYITFQRKVAEEVEELFGKMEEIRLLPFITIADATGDEMDQGTLVRYFNEMMWFPTAYVNDYIQLESIDSSSARATISSGGLSASAVLYFNEKGQMTNFVAERYMTVDDEYSLQTWSTPITEYREINDMMLPSKGEGVWNLSSGDFRYIRVEIIDIEYNNPSEY